MGVRLGQQSPAEKWVFISRRLIYRVGSEKYKIIVILELFDKAKLINSPPLKFSV